MSLDTRSEKGNLVWLVHFVCYCHLFGQCLGPETDQFGSVSALRSLLAFKASYWLLKRAHAHTHACANQMVHYRSVNGKWCIYIAPLSKALHRGCASHSPHSYTHSHTDARGNHARHQPVHREQFGVQCLAQGHFDTDSGGTRVWTGNLVVTIRSLYPWATSTLWHVPHCDWQASVSTVIVGLWLWYDGLSVVKLSHCLFFLLDVFLKG